MKECHEKAKKTSATKKGLTQQQFWNIYISRSLKLFFNDNIVIRKNVKCFKFWEKFQLTIYGCFHKSLPFSVH